MLAFSSFIICAGWLTSVPLPLRWVVESWLRFPMPTILDILLLALCCFDGPCVYASVLIFDLGFLPASTSAICASKSSSAKVSFWGSIPLSAKAIWSSRTHLLSTDYYSSYTPARVYLSGGDSCTEKSMTSLFCWETDKFGLISKSMFWFKSYLFFAVSMPSGVSSSFILAVRSWSSSSYKWEYISLVSLSEFISFTCCSTNSF